MKKKCFGQLISVKKIALSLLVAFLTLPAGFASHAAGGSDDAYVEQYNEDMARVGGYVPLKTGGQTTLRKGMLRAVPQQSSYPAYYRSDEQSWAAGIKVKDQGNAGLCWAFAITTSAEYSYAREFGSSPETSPGHLANFLCERVNDPLGNTAGDKNASLGPEYEHWSIRGSNYYSVIFGTNTWSGLGLEANTPYSVINNYIQDDEWVGPEGSLYDEKYAYNDCMVVENGHYFESPDQNRIKEMVTLYGALATSVPFYGEFMNYEHYALYPVSSKGDNHAVTIIGWDDNYPKENFAHKTRNNGKRFVVGGKELSDEEAIAYTTPPGDGAWIVQNSWAEDWGNDGFFYLSYYDCKDFYTRDSVAFDMMKPDTYKYNFFYDGTAGSGDVTDFTSENIVTSRGTKAANVFTNTTGEAITVDAVGYTIFNTGSCHFDVNIYTNLTDPSNPESGTWAGGGSFIGSYIGVKTAKLDTPARIEAGETYSVVFSFPVEDAIFGLEEEYESYVYNFVAQFDEGQSFYLPEDCDEWTDLAKAGTCYRIKAFANPAKSEGDPEEDPEEEIPPINWEDPIFTALAIAAENPEGGIADIKGNYALSYYVMKFLEDHPNVTLNYKVTYETHTYLITIPGKEVKATLEIPWYGPEWLRGHFKWTELPYEEYPM